MSKNLGEKEDFRILDEDYCKDVKELQKLMGKIQRKYGKSDSDTFLNEFNDYEVGRHLGFPCINVNKNGWDNSDSDKKEFLEVKECNMSAKSWGGTFNDTSEEKALEFKNSNVKIAIALKSYIDTIEFIVYGRNPEIGNYLLQRIKERIAGSRSTQTISISKFINTYGFKIKCINSDKDQVISMLKKKYPKTYFDVNTIFEE